METPFRFCLLYIKKMGFLWVYKLFSLKLFFFLLVGNKTITDIKINRKRDENNKENEGNASGKA